MKKVLLAATLLLSTGDILPSDVKTPTPDATSVVKPDEKPKVWSNVDTLISSVLIGMTLYIIYGYIDDYMHPEKKVNRTLDYLHDNYDTVLGLSSKSLESFKRHEAELINNCKLHIDKLESWLKRKSIKKDLETKGLIEDMQSIINIYKDLLSKFNMKKIAEICKSSSAAPYYI